MTGLPILEISGLNKSYGAVRAVDDVSLHVNRGEICGLIGPNGSGKSTFFDCASGLTKPQAGTVKLDGQDITGWSLNRIAREGRMLRSFQKTVVFSALDIEENLVIAGQMFTLSGPLVHLRHRRHGAGAGRGLARTRARIHQDRRPLGRSSSARRKAVGRPTEADSVCLDADAGAQTDPARRADGRHQSKTDRARRREHPFRQPEIRRQLLW